MLPTLPLKKELAAVGNREIRATSVPSVILNARVNNTIIYTRIHHIKIESGFLIRPKVLNCKENHGFKR